MSETRVRTPDLRLKKQRGEKVTMITAYDAPFAQLFDAAGVDVLLVGDSLGMVVLGYDTTIPVTLDMMVHHTSAVSRAATRALVVADLPFLTYQTSVADAVKNAGRLVQEGGAAVVKLEGGRPVIDVVRRLVDIGIPVMGHLGLLPQSVHRLGGYRRQGTGAADADAIFADAMALDAAGACAIVLEMIPSDLAATITSAVGAPTIGIGAGPDCDGQVLVGHDLLGLTTGPVPPFARQYAQLSAVITEAVQRYVSEVRGGQFPAVPAPATAKPR
jgi:3-methyl-2-oxobutanoate hydroxymethyltransferase